MKDMNELKAKEKHELSSTPEQTRPGLVFTPLVDIFETDKAITLLADMPGVTPDNIAIDLNENVLTINGEVAPWDKTGETDLLVEFKVGKYYRQFTLSEHIAQDKIEAKLDNGVLRLVMPKAEKAIPRKIAVTAG